MKAYVLILETLRRKSAVWVVHAAWLGAYAAIFLIPMPPESGWQWGAFLFGWSGCLMPVLLSAGIFGDDIASGRIRLVITEPIRPTELYLYRLGGLSLQGLAHILTAAVIILVLQRLTGRGRIDHMAVWLLASWLAFNTWTALSTSVSVVAKREHNSIVLILATGVVFLSLYLLLLFFEDSLGTQVYHGVVRYACPPIELLVALGRGRLDLLAGLGCTAHSLALTALYSVAGILLLGGRQFTGVAD